MLYINLGGTAEVEFIRLFVPLRYIREETGPFFCYCSNKRRPTLTAGNHRRYLTEIIKQSDMREENI